MPSRRSVLIGLAAGVGAVGVGGYFALKPIIDPERAVVGFETSPEQLKKAIELLERHASVDVHSHPGRTFVDGAKNLKWKLKVYAALGTFEDKSIEDMVSGHMGSVVFAGVSDFPLLNTTKGGLEAIREFEAGEAWEYYQHQIANLNALAEDGKVMRLLNPSDITKAHDAKITGAMMAMEGGDFIEEDLSRVETAFNDGLRMLTPVHYHNNPIGDIMTGPEKKDGLSGFGREVIGEMNRLGMMIDLSHAAPKTAQDMIETSNKPMLFTHTHIKSDDLDHSRFISEEMAQAVVEGGGVVGAWPAGIGISTLAQYIDRIDQLVEKLGEDAVVIGSDMDANYRPVYDNFRQMPLIVSAMLERGYSEARIAKIIGGNFMRVFAANMQG